MAGSRQAGIPVATTDVDSGSLNMNARRWKLKTIALHPTYFVTHETIAGNVEILSEQQSIGPAIREILAIGISTRPISNAAFTTAPASFQEFINLCNKYYVISNLCSLKNPFSFDVNDEINMEQNDCFLCAYYFVETLNGVVDITSSIPALSQMYGLNSATFQWKFGAKFMSCAIKAELYE